MNITMNKLLIIIFLVLIFITRLAMFIPSKDWSLNLVAEGVGAIVTTGLVSLIFCFWKKNKWKSIYDIITQDLNMRVSTMVVSMRSLLENRRISKHLIMFSDDMSLYDSKQWIKDNYNSKIDAFIFPVILKDLITFFERYTEIWTSFFRRYNDYLDPELLIILIELEDFFSSSHYELKQDNNYMEEDSENCDFDEGYINDVKQTLKNYFNKLLEYITKLEKLTNKKIVLRDSL